MDPCPACQEVTYELCLRKNAVSTEAVFGALIMYNHSYCLCAMSVVYLLSTHGVYTAHWCWLVCYTKLAPA